MAALAKRAAVLFLATTSTASHGSCNCEAFCAQLLAEQHEEIVRLRAEIRTLRSGTFHAAAGASAGVAPALERRTAASPTQGCDDEVVVVNNDSDMKKLEGCRAVQTLWISDNVNNLSLSADIETAAEIVIWGENPPPIENINDFWDLSPDVLKRWGIVLEKMLDERYLSGFENLKRVDGNLTIVNTIRLTDLHLASLTSVGGDLKVTGNLNLFKLEGLANLRTVGGDLIADSNTLLRSLSLTSLVSVGGKLVVKDLGPGLSFWDILGDEREQMFMPLGGLGNLQSVGGLWITGGRHVKSLEGIEKLTRVEGDVVLENMVRPLALKGLRHLESVRGDVTLRDNPSLASLEGLEGLRTVAGLQIMGNHKGLRSISSLSSLASARRGVIIEHCRLESLRGLGALSRAAELRVQIWSLCEPGTPMKILGGPLAMGASVDVVNIDEASWPPCTTWHERLALLTTMRDVGSSSLPKAGCPKSLPTLACTKGHPCSFHLGGVSGRVFVSGPTTGCGACPQNHLQKQVGDDGLVDFGDDLGGERAGLRSICDCDDELGWPLGQLSLRGPRQSVSTTCHRARNCTVKLDIEGGRDTDHVVLISGSSCSDGNPQAALQASWSGENEYLFHGPGKWYAAPAGLYQVCWRALCNSTADLACAAEKSHFHAGVLTLLGPFPSNEIRVLGQDLTTSNVGLGVVDGDRMRLMRSCGKMNQDGMAMLEARSSFQRYEFGALTEDRVRAGTHHLCWCREHEGATCEVEDFTADSGTVSIWCPAGHELASGSLSCRECPAGRQQLEAGLEPCSECSPGQSSSGGAKGCEVCQPGHVARLPGAAACVACWAWESADVAAIACSPNPHMVVLLVSFHLSVGAFCVMLVRSLRRQLSVADVQLERGCTVLTTLGPHGFSNFGRRSFPAKLQGTGHPGLDSPRQPLRVRVKDTARLELLTWEGDTIGKVSLDTSMGALTVAFPHGLYHQGWPVPVMFSLPALCVTTAVLGALAFTADVAAEASLGAAATVLLCLAASAAVRGRARATPLALRLSEFKQELGQLTHQGTRSCPRGPERAIALGKLHHLFEFFREFIRDRNAYYLTACVLVPLTRETQLSYAEFVGPGQVEWFVSHFWGTSYEHFCTALHKHAEAAGHRGDWEQVHYWVCFCSNNQHKIGEELGGGWQESSFYITLQSGLCRGTCMVLDDEALPLTRVWCIFELMQTVKLKRSRDEFQGLLLCTSSGLLNTGSGTVEVALALAKRVADMDLQTAQASSEADAKMIKEQVILEMGSFSALTRFVCAEVREALVRARHNTDGQFGSVLEYLEPAILTL